MSEAQEIMVQVLRWHNWKGRSLAPTRCLCGELVRDLDLHRADEIDKALGGLERDETYLLKPEGLVFSARWAGEFQAVTEC